LDGVRQKFKTPPLSNGYDTSSEARAEFEVDDAQLSHYRRLWIFCVQRRWQVVVFGILLAVAPATYDVRHFSITTDTDSLISQKLPWHQRQSALSKAFPQKGILIVVTAATPENAEQATNALEKELSQHSDLFHSVVQADSGEFFQHNGMLFEPLSDVKKSLDGLSKAKFLIEALTDDPSLRGVMKALSFVTGGVQGGEVKLDQLVWPTASARSRLADLPRSRRVSAVKVLPQSYSTIASGAALPDSPAPRIVETESYIGVPAQPVDATQALNLSAGVSNCKVSRGRSFSCRATLFRWTCECTDKSVPLGKYCLSRPFVFSFDPRCHGLCGSQK